MVRALETVKIYWSKCLVGHKDPFYIKTSLETILNIFWMKSFFSVLLVATVLPTWATDTKSIASLTAFQGAEAHQRLIDEAKKEGSLVTLNGRSFNP